MTIMNRTDTAAALGIAKTTLDQWVREGAPVVDRQGKKGVETQYDSGAVLRWWMARELSKSAGRANADDLDELRARKIELDCELKALELARERDEVVPLEMLTRGMSKAFAEVRVNVRNIPTRVATLLIGETDESRFKEVMLAEIDQALEALADAELLTESDLEGHAS